MVIGVGARKTLHFVKLGQLSLRTLHVVHHAELNNNAIQATQGDQVSLGRTTTIGEVARGLSKVGLISRVSTQMTDTGKHTWQAAKCYITFVANRSKVCTMTWNLTLGDLLRSRKVPVYNKVFNMIQLKIETIQKKVRHPLVELARAIERYNTACVKT